MIEYNDLIREKFYELQKNEISLKTFFDNQDFFKKIFSSSQCRPLLKDIGC